jgi:DNA-binding NtrC family response regulator
MEFDPSTDVILMTAHYSTESAVEAIRKGASDYLNKPISIATLRQRISALVDEARRRRRALQLEDELVAGCEFEGLVGNSPLMWEMFSKIRRIAPHYRTVLVTGETGSGKDLVARALHRLSPATAGRYVVLNCSAVVETLFESELFGHVKGAFTGATQDKMGLFEHAHGGTLFLDEIGDMPLATQAKLLRALQHQEIQRVGSLAARKVDVRVIAATHRNLHAAIAEKQFREDLYYRLAMVEIHVPRLGDRKEDLPLLQRSLIAKFAAQYGKTVRGLTPRAQMLLGRGCWQRSGTGECHRPRLHDGDGRHHRCAGSARVFVGFGRPRRRLHRRRRTRRRESFPGRQCISGRSRAAAHRASFGSRRRESIPGRASAAHRTRCTIN